MNTWTFRVIWLNWQMPVAIGDKCPLGADWMAMNMALANQFEDDLAFVMIALARRM